ncbi:MAG: NADH-quinone oxidoreductase subunit NuoE [Candidatus Kuenenia sp.]|nr:NADH-quinone oxidoreductase subunit NuoE [Candidatus Kuenenia hertensis]
MSQSNVKKYLENYGNTKEASIPILQAIQGDYGYLPLDILDQVCEESEITKTHLYGVATFYAQFKLTPKGKNAIKVCKGTACHVKGADITIVALKDQLGINMDQTTEDGEFSMETVACLGCCSLAPVVMINEDVYGGLSSAKVRGTLKKYGKE